MWGCEGLKKWEGLGSKRIMVAFPCFANSRAQALTCLVWKQILRPSPPGDPKTLTPEGPSPVQRMKSTESREHASPVSFYHVLLSLEHSLLCPHFYINTLYFIEAKHKNSLFPGRLYSFLSFKKYYCMCTGVLTKYVFVGHAYPRRPERISESPGLEN